MSTIEIPKYWTAEQALAVFEFLDEIKECIWNQYNIQIVELMQAERCTHTSSPEGPEDFDDEITF